MADQPQHAVPTRTPSTGRKLGFLRRKHRNKQPAAEVQYYTPASLDRDASGDKARLQQQEVWPDLDAAAEPRYEDNELAAPVSPVSDAEQDGEEPVSPPLPQADVDEPSYDLRPPPPTQSPANIEALSARLFSVDHLDAILSDHIVAARFSHFLTTYRPQHTKALKQYADAKKAVLAIEYANTIAGQLQTNAEHRSQLAAALDRGFQAQMNQDVDGLINDALPAYITHRLTQLVTDHLVKEITQNSAPIMREMIPNLAEVYCITDPSIQDNPIIYASQEFYNVSQYGREYVIGRNCRFLQGPKTSNASIKRLIEALRNGQEVCETMLNYRRDGSPFMNLLLIAPLYDNKGHLRYFLGCQIDVSPLIDRGRGLESFEQLLIRDRAESRYAGSLSRDPKYALARFGQMLSEEETGSIVPRTMMSEASSRQDVERSRVTGRQPRRIIGMDDVGAESHLWPHHSLGSSGRLPGVYQNYLLVRPYPSLRITFASPALRIPGLLQTKFLDRIGGPSHIRESVLDALAHGTGLTARVSWLTSSLNGVGGYTAAQPDSHIRWIHCTPLLGSDERIGVWMVVIVENEEVTGSLKRQPPPTEVAGSMKSGGQASAGASVRDRRKNLYAEYMRHDGRSRAEDQDGLDLNIDEEFHDF